MESSPRNLGSTLDSCVEHKTTKEPRQASSKIGNVSTRQRIQPAFCSSSQDKGHHLSPRACSSCENYPAMF
uniref:Uncharacterized protein n=1 Tax=Arundo donax TaxID=35708 RepID=A0A0A9D5K5_ARUDO